MINYMRIPLAFFLLSFTLLACNKPAEDPKAVADKYWQLIQSGNIAEAEKLVSINSKGVLEQHSIRTDSSDQLKNSEAKTIVSTTITTVNPDNNYSDIRTFDTVLVLEQGQWKVDVEQSQIPPSASEKEQQLQQLSDELSESMKQNMESIDDAMSEGMQLLNEAMREGSQEMGESLLNLMNELNNSMQESIEKMKERREQQLQQQQDQQPPQPPQTNPHEGEGMI